MQDKRYLFVGGPLADKEIPLNMDELKGEFTFIVVDVEGEKKYYRYVPRTVCVYRKWRKKRKLCIKTVMLCTVGEYADLWADITRFIKGSRDVSNYI